MSLWTKLKQFVLDNYALWIRLSPLIIAYILNYGGFSIYAGFQVLQIRSLGLSQEDATQIVAVAAILSTPGLTIAGYIGDKFGYYPVLCVTCFLFTAIAIGQNFLPLYEEIPKVQMAFEHHDGAFNPADSELIWFGSYMSDSTTCATTPISLDIAKIKCGVKSYDINLALNGTLTTLNSTAHCTDIDHDYCTWSLKIPNGTVEYCQSAEEDALHEGSLSTTYWSYLILRVAYIYLLNAYYTVADGMASTTMRRENVNFVYIVIGGGIANIIAPIVGGKLLDDFPVSVGEVSDCLAHDKERETYLSVYIAMVIIFYLTLVFCYCVDGDIAEEEKRKISLKDDFEWLKNPAAIGFYTMLLCWGTIMGVEDASLNVYFKTLGVSNTMIGHLEAVGSCVGLGFLLIFPFLQRKLGNLNLILMILIMQSTQMIIVSYTWNDPPYELYAIRLITMKELQFPSVVGYVAEIAPHDLVATALGMSATSQFIIGKAFGSYISGLLQNQLGERWMFRVVGGTLLTCGLLYTILYHTCLKRFEPDPEELNKVNRDEEDGEKTNENDSKLKIKKIESSASSAVADTKL